MVKSYEQSVTYAVITALFQATTPMTRNEIATLLGQPVKTIGAVLHALSHTPEIRSQLTVNTKRRSWSYWLVRKNETVDELYKYYQSWSKEARALKENKKALGGEKKLLKEISSLKKELVPAVVKAKELFGVGQTYNLVGETVIKSSEIELSVVFDVIVKRIS